MTNYARIAEYRDRDMPDVRTDFDEWYDSMEYQLWHLHSVEMLLGGGTTYGIADKHSAIAQVQCWAGRNWSELDAGQREAVNVWEEYADICAMAYMEQRFDGADKDATRKIKEMHEKRLEEVLDKIYSHMVDKTAERYFEEYLA